MDEIRQNILREQEARKARLSSMLNTSFGENDKKNDEKEDEIEKEVKKSEIDEFNKAYSELFDDDSIEKAKHQIGDSHPKWPQLKWTDLGGGKFGWRTGTGRGKRAKVADNASSSSGGSTGGNATQTTQAKPAKKETTKTQKNSIGKVFKMGDAVQYQKKGGAPITGQIIDIDTDGRYVQVRNQSTHDIDYVPINALDEPKPYYSTDSKNRVQSADTKPKVSPNMRKLIDAFRISSNKYTDPEKMSITTTPKGNWELRYDGKRVSVIGSLDIDRDEFDDLGITTNS